MGEPVRIMWKRVVARQGGGARWKRESVAHLLIRTVSTPVEIRARPVEPVVLLNQRT
jgi:hypothetical protein